MPPVFVPETILSVSTRPVIAVIFAENVGPASDLIYIESFTANDAVESTVAVGVEVLKAVIFAITVDPTASVYCPSECEPSLIAAERIPSACDVGPAATVNCPSE
ncbi:hypothetical protein D3C71_1364800 [compost metagenome]